MDEFEKASQNYFKHESKSSLLDYGSDGASSGGEEDESEVVKGGAVVVAIMELCRS